MLSPLHAAFLLSPLLVLHPCSATSRHSTTSRCISIRAPTSHLRSGAHRGWVQLEVVQSCSCSAHSEEKNAAQYADWPRLLCLCARFSFRTTRAASRGHFQSLNCTRLSQGRLELSKEGWTLPIAIYIYTYSAPSPSLPSPPHGGENSARS